MTRGLGIVLLALLVAGCAADAARRAPEEPPRSLQDKSRDAEGRGY